MKRYNLIVVFLCLSFISFGQCIGDCENGNGTYKYKSGEKYKGEWLNGRQNGQGILTAKDYKYDGEWLNGKKNGYGVYEDESIKYKGEWLDGKRNGQGILTHKDYKYDGEWLNDKKNGYGVLKQNKPKKFESNKKYANLYEGYFKNDKFHGDGSLTFYNNEIWTGIFKEGKRFEGHYNTENYYNPNDIIGAKDNCKIQLEPLSNGINFNIQVSFGEIKQTYLYDTGCSYALTIPKSFLKKLEKSGIKIERLNVTSKAKIADKSTIKINEAKISGVKIGDFTINNLIVGICDSECSFLLGPNSAWAKFDDYSLSGKKGVLTLYK
tara:strand:- start:611 stop:1579 length:969 start_codon:yes stop_codon:yes gene_type:complete